MRFAAGTPVRIVTTKWGGRPHWIFDGTYLGVDDHGDWLGFTAGTHFERPGAAFTADVDHVVVLPRDDRGWVATFLAPGLPFTVYVDIATTVHWEGHDAAIVDLDLDVIRRADGGVEVLDEDEFAEHRTRFGYPAEIVDRALASLTDAQAALLAESPPFDPVTWERWLARLG